MFEVKKSFNKHSIVGEIMPRDRCVGVRVHACKRIPQKATVAAFHPLVSNISRQYLRISIPILVLPCVAALCFALTKVPVSYAFSTTTVKPWE